MPTRADWQRPPPRVELAATEVHVWRIALDAVAHDHASRLSTLSESECQRAGRFRFEVDRRRFVTSHAALRDILAAYLGAAPSGLVFAEGPYGKPFLVGP